jgi:predicted N-acetyltransferase YhbS
MQIRAEKESDQDSVHQVHLSAFESPSEANLVDTTLGVVAVVVLGHPEYYPRFGFSPSSQFDINSEYEVPKEVFMAMELQTDALRGKTGRVKYHAAFSSV